jgi:hypothetical protein
MPEEETQNIHEEIRSLSLKRYREISAVVAHLLSGYNNAEAVAVLDLARSELLLEHAQQLWIAAKSREQDWGQNDPLPKLLDIESRLDKRDIQQPPSYTNVALANLRDPRGSVIG